MYRNILSLAHNSITNLYTRYPQGINRPWSSDTKRAVKYNNLTFGLFLPLWMNTMYFVEFDSAQEQQ